MIQDGSAKNAQRSMARSQQIAPILSGIAELSMTNLEELLAQAQAKYDAMTPEQQQEMWRQQRRSFIIGEAGMGSDADEKAYRAAQISGDTAKIAGLDTEANQRMQRAKKWLDDNGK
jgi:hypothetical protein